MMKTARMLALALAMFGTMSFAQQGHAAFAEDFSSQNIVVTDGMIARLKAALHLSPAQEPHWRLLETTLRDISQQRQVADASGTVGFVQRVRARVKSYVIDVSAARRVAAAARPLIATLDEGQKRDGLTVVRALGVSSLF